MNRNEPMKSAEMRLYFSDDLTRSIHNGLFK